MLLGGVAEVRFYAQQNRDCVFPPRQLRSMRDVRERSESPHHNGTSQIQLDKVVQTARDQKAMAIITITDAQILELIQMPKSIVNVGARWRTLDRCKLKDYDVISDDHTRTRPITLPTSLLPEKSILC